MRIPLFRHRACGHLVHMLNFHSLVLLRRIIHIFMSLYITNVHTLESELLIREQEVDLLESLSSRSWAKKEPVSVSLNVSNEEEQSYTNTTATTFPLMTQIQKCHPMLVSPIGPAKTVRKVINHSPVAVAAPPICLYSKGAISLQYNHTQPCHAYPNTKRNMKITPMLAHWIEGVGGTATRIVKMVIRMVIVIAP